MQRYSKKIQPMYLEQLCFAINRAGWSVTKIYSHYTFKQECFKKSSRQNAKNSIEKDFYKLMNNSNFGYDCHNNFQLVPIIDELQEIIYLKRYYNYFDSKVSSFVSSDLIRQEIEEKYNDLVMKLSKDDKYYEIKLSTLNAEESKSLEAPENFDKKIKEIRKLELESLIDFD